MSLLGLIGWGVFGGMAAKEGIENELYKEESKQKAQLRKEDIYYDKKGRTYYVPTGEEVYNIRKDGCNVYISKKTNKIVKNVTLEWIAKRNSENYESAIKNGKGVYDRYFVDTKSRTGYTVHTTEIATGKRIGISSGANCYFKYYYLPGKNILDSSTYTSISYEEYVFLGGI